MVGENKSNMLLFVVYKSSIKIYPQMCNNDILERTLSVNQNIIVTKSSCPYCIYAINLLNKKKIPFESYECSKNKELDDEITNRNNYRTYPKIYLDKKFIGGFSELESFLNK